MERVGDECVEERGTINIHNFITLNTLCQGLNTGFSPHVLHHASKIYVRHFNNSPPNDRCHLSHHFLVGSASLFCGIGACAPLLRVL